VQASRLRVGILAGVLATRDVLRRRAGRGAVGVVLTDPRGLVAEAVPAAHLRADVVLLSLGGRQPLLPAGLHRPDEAAANADHDDAADGRKDGDEHRRGDGRGDADLVESGHDAEEEDEDGRDVGQHGAVGQTAQDAGHQVLDHPRDRRGDDDDHDGDDDPRKEGDDVLQQVADRVRAEDVEGDH
jgi:hypothetical protein